jgi:nucleoside-diphosphate-sugar epimerase
MRKNILVIGGTRYFGKLLVQRLLQAGHRVTIATRGRTADPFGARIERIRVDRRTSPVTTSSTTSCATAPSTPPSRRASSPARSNAT